VISTTPRPREIRRPRRRGLAVARFTLRVLVVAAVFAAGVALGEALHDNPKPSGTVTGVRTLKPLPLPPITRTATRSR
jgi:hypothetical protein